MNVITDKKIFKGVEWSQHSVCRSSVLPGLVVASLAECSFLASHIAEPYFLHLLYRLPRL